MNSSRRGADARVYPFYKSYAHVISTRKFTSYSWRLEWLGGVAGREEGGEGDIPRHGISGRSEQVVAQKCNIPSWMVVYYDWRVMRK